MTVSYVITLPIIDAELAQACLSSMAPELRGRTLVVDNTARCRYLRAEWGSKVLAWQANVQNVGVARSWNCGLTEADHQRADYCILLSQSITFGEPGGVDFISALDERRPKVLMHGQYGWKLIALASYFWRTVGRFDPVFSPGYYEESDAMYRSYLAGMPCPLYNDGEYDQIEVQAQSAGDGLSIRRRLVSIDYDGQRQKFVDKWGGEPRYETYMSPYGDDSLDWLHTGGPPAKAGTGGCRGCGGHR